MVRVREDGTVDFFDSAKSASRMIGKSLSTVYHFIRNDCPFAGGCWYYQDYWSRLNIPTKWKVYPLNKKYEVSSDGQVRLRRSYSYLRQRLVNGYPTVYLSGYIVQNRRV